MHNRHSCKRHPRVVAILHRAHNKLYYSELQQYQQASKMCSTSSWSRLLAWNPSFKGSARDLEIDTAKRWASGPVQNNAKIEGREKELLKLLHIPILASVVAAKALLLADLMRVSLLKASP